MKPKWLAMLSLFRQIDRLLSKQNRPGWSVKAVHILMAAWRLSSMPFDDFVESYQGYLATQTWV